MDLFVSCDDASVDYHDIDRLGLSLPLDDEDTKSEDGSDQVN